MGYDKAIEATGVKIKEYKEFGSYQGTWVAVLEDGRIIEGSYGSCSGCDAYQAEFDYSEPQAYDDGTYRSGSYDDISKEEYDAAMVEYNEKLRTFGLSYVSEAQTFDEAIARYEKKISDEYAWEDDKEIYEWLKQNKP